MKKGFTLIELLAVIVILAIIALIAVPIVINIIENSKKNTSLRSADFYLDAVEISIADRVMHHGSIPDGAYPIMSDGNICLKTYNKTSNSETCTDTDNIDDNEILKVEVNGDKPASYQIAEAIGQTFSGSGISGLPTWLNSYTKAPIAFGYWTSTPNADNSLFAWYVNYSGVVNDGDVVVCDGYFGVRPVITISKNNIK